MMNTVKVGDGATVNSYSDREAYTVVGVSKSGQVLTLQRDKATIDPNWKREFIPGGFFGHTANNGSQTYTYEQDPQGSKVKAYWRPARQRFYAEGRPVSLGVRSEFYDFNF